MDMFLLTLNQMLTMFTYMVVGFVLRRKKILPESSYVVLSRLETYFFLPALLLNNWMKNCNITTLRDNASIIFYGMLLIVVAVFLSYPLSRLFVKKKDGSEYLRNIYKYAMTFGNHGFVGNFVVLGIWGDEMLFKYSMLTLCASFACNSWGVFVLVPQEGEKRSVKSVVKRMFTPSIIAVFVGLIAGLTNVSGYVPQFVNTVLAGGASCMGPVAMVLAGIVIGGYDLKEILKQKKVYAATFMRLIVLPTAFVLGLRLLGAGVDVRTLALIAFGAPIGLNTIVYPAAYGGDTKTGASMALISHALSVITIPLMYLLLIELI